MAKSCVFLQPCEKKILERRRPGVRIGEGGGREWDMEEGRGEGGRGEGERRNVLMFVTSER